MVADDRYGITANAPSMLDAINLDQGALKLVDLFTLAVYAVASAVVRR